LTVHRLLGRGEVAFLKARHHLFHSLYISHLWILWLYTPYFALRTDEVPPSTLPVSGPLGWLTFQYFCDSDPSIIAQPNQDARPPNDLTPSIITDFIYGYAVVRKWGSKRSTEMLQDLTQDFYYKGNAPARDIGSQKREQQKRRRSNRLEARIQRRDKGKNVEHGDSHGMTLRGEKQKFEMEEIMDWISFLCMQTPVGPCNGMNLLKVARKRSENGYKTVVIFNF